VSDGKPLRILHTADWHAGRTLMGRDRTPEIRAALQEIAELALQQAVDLVLVAGDVFDTRNPGAAAEQAVYEFFHTVGRAGIRSVVIAGNHDSPARLDAVAQVLGLANVHVLGTPRARSAGGTLVFGHDGFPVRVAGLPFVSERRIVTIEKLLELDATDQKRYYQEVIGKFISNLTHEFDSDGVNLLMLHGTMENARLSASEYRFHSTKDYTLDPGLLPLSASYTALGHMHMPQRIENHPAARGRYSGSIIQLDFGEQGDRKYVYLLEARPGRPVELLDEVQVRAGRQLQRVALTPADLDRRLLDLADFEGWLKIVLKLDEPRPGLKDRIMGSLPNAISVEVELPDEETAPGEEVDIAALDLLDAYRSYYREVRGTDAADGLIEAFSELHGLVWDDARGDAQ
jgi:exonuclease SbcD